MNQTEATTPRGPDRFSGAVQTIARSIGVGGVGGGAAGLLALAVDPHGASAKLAALSGVILGAMNGYLEIRVKNRRAMAQADADYRRLMIEAESSEDRRKLIEKERELRECEARYDELIRRFDRLEADHREMSDKIDRMRERYDDRLERLYTATEKAINKGLRHDVPGEPTP